jgi:hypothetical protein
MIVADDIDACEPQLWIDGVWQTLPNNNGSWPPRQINYIPKVGYWSPGHHRMRVKYRRGKETIAADSHHFVVQWDIDYHSPDDAARLLMHPVIRDSCRGLVTVDSGAGQLVIAPRETDPDNPSSISSVPFASSTKPYRLLIDYVMTQPRRATLQIVLPGLLTLQIGDGLPNGFTIKLRDKYFDAQGYPTQAKKRNAWRFTEMPISGKDASFPLVIEYAAGVISVFRGWDREQFLFRRRINPALLDWSQRSLVLRAYGAEVRVNEVMISPIDWAKT